VTRRAATLILVLLLAGCTRSVQIGSDPGVVYAVEIRNTLQQDMIVAYDDGGGARTLGTVRGNGSERFIITAPARQSVAITARNAAGTRSAGPYTVQLVAGDTPSVSLR
jgi:hypothetical protein